MSRNKHLAIRGVFLLVVIVTVREYAKWTWINPLFAGAIVTGREGRPFVYRALVPWLAHLLGFIGLDPHQALTLTLILSAIGLVYGIEYLIKSIRQ